MRRALPRGRGVKAPRAREWNPSSPRMGVAVGSVDARSRLVVSRSALVQYKRRSLAPLFT
jgi:hypothetical protein